MVLVRMLWLNWLAGGLLALSLFLNGLAVWRARKFMAKRAVSAGSLPSKPPVSVIVPVCGIEGNGLEHFQQFCRLDWPEYQVVFVVLEESDPAVPLLRQIRSTPNCLVNFQISGKATGANRKVRSLINAQPLVRHEWMVVCDADVQPESDFLKGLIAPFFETELSRPPSNVGLVHCFYRCLDETTLASSWEQVWINSDFWVQALLGDWVQGTDYAFGAAMSFHRDTLKQIGGFEVIRDYLADDYQLGHRIHTLGKKLVFNRDFVTLKMPPQSWLATWKHLMRWSRTIRVCQPGGFAGSILTNITFFALLSIALHPSLFLAPGLGALALRLYWGNQCRNWITGHRGIWKRCWLIGFKDLAQVVLWLLAFRNGPVEWRGTRYQLKSGGQLQPI